MKIASRTQCPAMAWGMNKTALSDRCSYCFHHQMCVLLLLFRGSLLLFPPPPVIILSSSQDMWLFICHRSEQWLHLGWVFFFSVQENENPHPYFTLSQCLKNPVCSPPVRPLSKVISWIFLQREAVWPLCVRIKGQYGTESPSLTLSWGSRGLQQLTAMLIGYLGLIGFDIEKWPPAT